MNDISRRPIEMKTKTGRTEKRDREIWRKKKQLKGQATEELIMNNCIQNGFTCERIH